MEAKKSEDQVTLIPQTISLSQKSLDLIVDAFHKPGVVLLECVEQLGR
jgi:hypothetical protein